MKYFTRKELECKCGCELYNVTDEFLEKLNQARSIAGVPFKVNSCCRCAQHNKDEGGSETSSHLSGVAVDLSSFNSRERFKILEGAILAEFTRIGLGEDFIHLDIDSTKDQEVAWLY